MNRRERPGVRHSADRSSRIRPTETESWPGASCESETDDRCSARPRSRFRQSNWREQAAWGRLRSALSSGRPLKFGPRKVAFFCLYANNFSTGKGLLHPLAQAWSQMPKNSADLAQKPLEGCLFAACQGGEGQAGDLGGQGQNTVMHAPAFGGEAQHVQTVIFFRGELFDQAALRQTTHDTVDGRVVHGRLPPERVLRRWLDLGQLDQCGELLSGEPFAHMCGEDAEVPLLRLAQKKPRLRVQHIATAHTFRGCVVVMDLV